MEGEEEASKKNVIVRNGINLAHNKAPGLEIRRAYQEHYMVDTSIIPKHISSETCTNITCSLVPQYLSPGI